MVYECCPLNKSDVKSLDFAVRAYSLSDKTILKFVNLDLINECRFCFNFSYTIANCLEKRIAKFQKDTKALAT